MKIIIFGCGKIGSSILRRLESTKNEIIAIDENPNVIEKIADSMDVLAICADATNFHVLEDADVRHADVVIACTNFNTVNLSVCNMAKKLGAKHTVAQVRRADYTIADLEHLRKMFDVDWVYNPDLVTATEIFTRINEDNKSRNIKHMTAKVMIFGASRVAVHLSRLLVKAGYNVKILEKDSDKCLQVCALVPDSVYVTCADGTEKTVLYEEGIERTDYFVALSNLDEQNLLISVFAKSRNVGRVITKVKHNSYQNLVDNLGLTDILAPKLIAADHVAEYIGSISE